MGARRPPVLQAGQVVGAAVRRSVVPPRTARSAHRALNPVIDAIAARRSVGRLVDPAPEGEDLDALIQAAAAAPDHGRLRPSRFIALRGTAKDEFGKVLERAYLKRCEQAGTEPIPEVAAKERSKLGRAPLVLVAATVHPPEGSRQANSRIPWQERLMSTAAAVQNVLLAATALGYGSMWRTGESARDPVVKEALGLAPADEITGFIYLGTQSPETARLPPHDPNTDGLLVDWRAID